MLTFLAGTAGFGIEVAEGVTGFVGVLQFLG